MELLIRSEIDQAEITPGFFLQFLPWGNSSVDVYWYYIYYSKCIFSSPEALAPHKRPRVWQSKR